MVDHVDDQAHVSVNEVFPCPRFSGEAAFEQMAVDFGKRHEESPGISTTANGCEVPRFGRKSGIGAANPDDSILSGVQTASKTADNQLKYVRRSGLVRLTLLAATLKIRWIMRTGEVLRQ
jgi:hypothetical protein